MSKRENEEGVGGEQGSFFFVNFTVMGLDACGEVEKSEAKAELCRGSGGFVRVCR